MSPADDLQRRSGEEDSIEQEGIAAWGSVGASEARRVGVSQSRRSDADRLPPSQTAVEEIPEGRDRGAEARQRGTEVQPRPASQRAFQDSEAGSEKIQRGRADAVRTDPGSRAPGERGPDGGASGNAAALDAGRRIVEQGAEP